jgi:energy-coupling factor transporter ATP-binding protein EcfA2
MSAQEIPLAGAIRGAQDDFEVWLGERHRWMQSAAKNLIESKKIPDQKQLEILAELCLAEASGAKHDGFSVVTPGSLFLAAVRAKLHIDGLSNVRGVNAIIDNATLNFGKTNLAVVYGPNGSGKTGYARVLKQACGCRAKEEIYGDVFEKDNPPSQAKLHISIADVSHEVKWFLQEGAVSALRDVHLFDAKAASMYITAQNEATYEPSRMRFVSSLIKICDRMALHLNTEKQNLVKKLPQLPLDFTLSPAAKWFNSLKAGIKEAAINEACNYSQEHDTERISIEGNLAQKDIIGRLQTISKERITLEQVKGNFLSLRDALSNAEIENLLASRRDAGAKRKAAGEDAEKVFGNAPLEGVGQASWMSLWEHARRFSEAHAYPNIKFPNVVENAHCVLCQQHLTVEGRDRLTHFESFVKGALEAAAKDTEKNYEALKKKLPLLPKEKDWLVQTSILKMPEEMAVEIFKALKARLDAAEIALQLPEVRSVDWQEIESAILAISNAFDSEEKGLKELQQDGKRKQFEMRILELRGMQWLNQNKAAIIDEVARLESLSIFDKAVRLANTVALTKKNNELAKLELDAGYQKRFAEELKKLGGNRLLVKPVSKELGKGKISFGLALQGAEKALAASYVLSEGETRIVALSAFLADIAGSGQPSPFIFDDPISSLDQDFEERVVARLIELSASRQVIVFTHRLSLLTLFDSAVKKLKDQAEIEKKASAVDIHIETLRRFGKNSGIVQQLNIRDVKPKSAINRIRDEYLPQLRKLYENQDIAAYETRSAGLCSDFRILIERCVENILLNDVLLRFRRSVQTQGRIGALAKINKTDCDLIDNLMTRYSAFEHSQSDELPAVILDIDQFEGDVMQLALWIEEFGKRRINEIA